ncbi:MAG: response regulator transcription factor [Enterococcus sp.]|nr:response regulator transcription factor [Enterococcus sp.]
MLSIIICEDDSKQLQRMEQVITNYVMIEDLDAQLVLATKNPEEVLEYVTSNSVGPRLYFLDVDLQHELTGITLASEIRKVDDIGKIVFVTTHGELSYLTFTYKVEAMDYILKERAEDVEHRIRECIDLAIKRYLSEGSKETRKFTLTLGDSIRTFPLNDILFFESGLSPHKIVLHTKNRQIDFYGSIKNLENIEDGLFRCHKSFVVNINKVKEVNKTNRILILENDIEIPIAVRAMKRLKEWQ